MELALGAVAVLLLAVAVVYNGLVVRRNRCENAFATIDVMLRKRYDLIPNLVETVRGYADHEREVLEEIVRLRSRAAGEELGTDEAVRLNNRITTLLGQVTVVAENYPELKADEHFLQLQRALNEIEAQVAAARRAYNAAVLDLNNAVEMFPTSLIASGTGFRRRHFLETPGEEGEVPDVANRLDRERG